MTTGGALFGCGGLRVLDAGVINTAQRDLERLGDAGELAEGEIRVVELALGETFVDHAIDQLLDRLDVALAVAVDTEGRRTP